MGEATDYESIVSETTETGIVVVGRYRYRLSHRIGLPDKRRARAAVHSLHGGPV